VDLLTNVATDLYNKVISNGYLMTKAISETSRVYLCIGVTWSIGGGGGAKSTIGITYLLTQWRRVLLEKLTGSELVKKFPAI